MNTTWEVVKIKLGKKVRLVRDLNPWPMQCWANNSANKPTGSWSFCGFINPWMMNEWMWIYGNHIFELRIIVIIAITNTTWTVVKIKPEKIQACAGVEPMTSAILVQCSTNYYTVRRIGTNLTNYNCYRYNSTLFVPRIRGNINKIGKGTGSLK